VLGQLNGDGTDPAGASLNEDLLPRLEVHDVVEGLVTGEADERQGGRRFETQIAGHPGDGAVVNGDVFCKGPDAVLSHPTEHGVAHRVIRDGAAHGRHGPGKVAAQDHRQVIGQ
jgi:hypothetical protein